MIEDRLKRIIISEDKAYGDTYSIAVGRGNSWKLRTFGKDKRLLRSYLEGILMASSIPVRNIRNGAYFASSTRDTKPNFGYPAYPIDNKLYQELIEHLTKYKQGNA
jgi:hypothetical protein